MQNTMKFLDKFKFVLILVLFFGLAYVMINSAGRSDVENPILPQKEVFKPSDKLVFILDFEKTPRLISEKNYGIQKVMADTTGNYSENDLTISANIIYTADENQNKIPLQIEKESETRYILSGENMSDNLLPGEYKVAVDVTKGNNTTSFEQDFAWGVLAINTNRSIYTPSQSALISIAVLDQKGEMVCDAEVNLEIKNPEGKTQTFTTTDNTIRVSPNCSKKEYIPTPDYETNYVTGKSGKYTMVLTALTSNGSYSITDEFEVRDHVPFDIERKSATRIFPPVDYPVTLTIKANENFKGIIKESVPVNFEIKSAIASSVNRTINENYNPNVETAQFVQKVELYPDEIPINITIDKNKKNIEWEVDLQAGEEIQLQYVYRAPEISPEFYLLGPLELFSENNKLVFTEIRQWQIAADAIAYVTGASATGGNNSSLAPSLTVAANDLVVLFCMTKTSKTITLTGTGWTNVYSESGTPTQYTWYKISAGATENPTCSWTGNDFAGAIMMEYSGVETTAGSILDTNNSATGSGDTTVECPSVTPSTGNHVYISAFSITAGSSSISTWSNSFTERYDFDNGGGNPANRQVYASADKISTGTQSTTATAGASGAWRCHTLAFNEDIDMWTGRVFTDDNESSALTSQSICAVVDAGSANCTTTDGSGWFTIAVVDASAGSELTFFLDGGTNFANTKTITDGGDIISSDNLRLYQAHLVLRHEQGASIAITDLDQYDNDQNATDMLFDAEAGTPNTLTVETPNELFVQTGFTFAPAGNVTSSHDIEIDGVWTAAASETVNLSGTYKLDVGGTLNPSTSTITFDGTGGIEDLITDGTGGPYNLVINDGGNALTVEVEDPLVVRNTVTITGGTLDAKSGENNQITVHNSWDNDDTFQPQSGTVLFDGSGATTYTIDAQGVGTPDFYSVTFNDSGGGATYQLTTTADINGNVTITGGTFNSNGNNITVGGNWTNSDIFTEGTNTVTFDGGAAATVNTGCANAATCTNENFYNMTINKSEDSTVTLSTNHLRITNTLTILAGWLIQGALNLQAEGTTAVDVKDFGRWQNMSTGSITLGGAVTNDGAITINSNGAACGDADSITIASTAAAQRSWSGAGAFRITDVNVSYQAGTATIYTASSTNSLNNGSNWIFVDCSMMLLEGLQLEGININ